MLLAVALLGAGCGDDAAPSGPFVTLRLTKDFGRELLAEERLPLEGHETVLRLLRENHDVDLDRFHMIVGVDGMRDTFGSRSLDESEWTTWETNVNGVEIDVKLTVYRLFPGDVAQVDLRDADGSFDTRASVGAFPQPFSGGLIGFRPTVTLDCVAGYERACQTVRRKLRAAGVDPTGTSPRQAPAGPATRHARSRQPVIRRARIHVGPWSELRDRPWPSLVDSGPDNSGVAVRFSKEGDSVQLLDTDRRPTKSLGAGTGLIGAMCPSEADIVWLVTGVDREGVERAARALTDEGLRDAYGAAISDAGVEKLPLPPAG